MKKFLLLIVLTVLLLVLCFAVVIIIKEENGERFTNDISNYNSSEYPIPNTIFPSEIPANSIVVSYSNYNYWSEAADVYLELKFNSAEEIEAYLNKIEFVADKLCIETQNIYCESYTDMFLTSLRTYKGEDIFTGYRITPNSETVHYNCNFGVISYSLKELTVIHSYTYGTYVNGIHDYVPQYFKRFNVPLHEDHQRLFYLEQ